MKRYIRSTATEPTYRSGDIVYKGNALGYQASSTIQGDISNFPDELADYVRNIYYLADDVYKVEWNIDSDGYIDLSGNISANAGYAYTPTDDGWLALYVQTTGFHTENAVAIFNGTLNSYQWAVSITAGINLARLGKYHGAVILPVKAGIPYLCWIKIDSSTTLSSKRLYFYKATGNV